MLLNLLGNWSNKHIHLCKPCLLLLQYLTVGSLCSELPPSQNSCIYNYAHAKFNLFIRNDLSELTTFTTSYTYVFFPFPFKFVLFVVFAVPVPWPSGGGVTLSTRSCSPCFVMNSIREGLRLEHKRTSSTDTVVLLACLEPHWSHFLNASMFQCLLCK